MSNSARLTTSRRRFLGLGAAGLIALPVAVAIAGRPKRSNACAGPVVGGGTPTTTVPPRHDKNKVRTASVRPHEGLGQGGQDHRQF
jgi:hypothetical protein